MLPSTKLTNRATIVVALGFLTLAMAYSARAIIGLSVPIWETELGWTRGQTANVAAIALLVMAIVAPISGAVLDRKGLRFTLLVGMIAVCISCIIVSLANNIWVLLIGFGIIGGIGFGIIATHVIAAAVARVYPKSVGFASGIATSGSTAGQFLIVPLVALLLGSFSWRWGFVGLGIGTALLIPFIWVIPDEDTSKAKNSPSKLSGGHTLDANLKTDLAKLASSPVFHLLFWSYLICGYTTSGVIETHLLPYASFCGFLPVPSATAYGILSAFNLIGMISVGWLTDRMNRPLLLGAIYIIRGLTFWILLNVGSDYETLILFAIIFGMVDYSTVPVTTSLVVSHLGLRVVGLVMGLLTAGHQLGAAAGAALGGYFFDQNSSYDLVWSSSIALAIIAGVLVFVIRDKPST
ncbi:MAG: MFS transporter [Gammaproteobacteria bacterium]|nr:MFS transporter [Gammaproteobacteria bacterium]